MAGSGGFGGVDIRRSNDGGMSWQAAQTPEGVISWASAFEAASDGRWLAVYSSGVLHSDDQGQTWHDLNSAGLLNRDEVTVLFSVGGAAFVGTQEGTISQLDLSSSDPTWSLQAADPSLGSILALRVDPNTLNEDGAKVLIAGTENGLYWTNDGGNTFQKVDTSDLPSPFDQVSSIDYTDGHLLIATDTGVYYAIDQIPRPLSWAVWNSVGFVLAFAALASAGLPLAARFLKKRRREAKRRQEEELRRQREQARQKEIQAEVSLARQTMRGVLQLPEGPFERPGVRLAHRLQQATSISGDFYNIIPRGDGSVGIYLVDVEGHGLVAAQTAQDVHRVLTDSSLNWGTGEAREQLEIADRAVYERLGDRSVSVTMCFAEVDPFNHVVRFANAGMPLPLLFRRDEALPEELRAAGVYVGAGYAHHPVKPERAEVTVGEGDLLVLYSDGIIEAEDAGGRLFGTQGLVAVVTSALQASPETIVDAVLTAVKKHAGIDEPADDQTLIVVRIGAVDDDSLGPGHQEL